MLQLIFLYRSACDSYIIEQKLLWTRRRISMDLSLLIRLVALLVA